MVAVNKGLARKVLSLVDAGLVKGLGVAEPGKMCVEAAVNYALGASHGDKPSCVGRAVREFKIRLNDANWPSNKDRAVGMRKLAIAQLGSDTIDQKAFAQYVALHTVKRIVPLAFRAAVVLMPKHKDTLEGAAVGCEVSLDFVSARAAASAATAVAFKVHADAAYAAADAAYSAIAHSDSYYYSYSAVVAYAYAAADAAAAGANAAAAERKEAPSKVLMLCAQIGLEALQEQDSPGCKWLDLCEE